MEIKVIFFDVETNGINPNSSVLSISALKASYNIETNEMKKIDVFDRFYFRNDGENPNYDALRVNGLYDEEIEARRNESLISYPKTFKEDVQNFYQFCDGAKHFIAHNIRFDRQFIPFKLEYQFDTMLENINIVKVPNTNRHSGYKWPKLLECAKFYNIKLEEEQLHNSMYDVLIMARIVYVMSKNKMTSNIIRRFLVDNISTEILN